MPSVRIGTGLVPNVVMFGYPRLLVDMSGTYSRLLWQWNEQQSEAPVIVENKDYSDPLVLLRAFIKADAPPAVIALAVAAPVDGGIIHLTNRRGWSFSCAQLTAALEDTPVQVLNDFTALALGIPHLDPDKRVQIGGGTPVPDAALAVLGPGTGLGVSGLLRCADHWVAINGEGGHVTLPVMTEAEYRLIRSIVPEGEHVSAERVLSGDGLARLYAYHRGQTDKPVSEPKTVTQLAAEGDPAARQALAMFFALLGTVAGDLALTLGARGGVYLAGGILPRLIDALLASEFRARFIAKGRFQDYLAAIPTYLITDPVLSLRGLAAWLDRT